MIRSKVELGETVHEHIMFDSSMPSRELYEGTVIYIHPEGRFYRVEFQLEGGTVREAYPLGVAGNTETDGRVGWKSNNDAKREIAKAFRRRKKLGEIIPS